MCKLQNKSLCFMDSSKIGDILEINAIQSRKSQCAVLGDAIITISASTRCKSAIPRVFSSKKQAFAFSSPSFKFPSGHTLPPSTLPRAHRTNPNALADHLQPETAIFNPNTQSSCEFRDCLEHMLPSLQNSF